MCCRKKCGVREDSAYTTLLGKCKQEESIGSKIRIPDRLDRKKFMERIDKILEEDQDEVDGDRQTIKMKHKKRILSRSYSEFQ